jgi:hypothetical protein
MYKEFSEGLKASIDNFYESSSQLRDECIRYIYSTMCEDANKRNTVHFLKPKERIEQLPRVIFNDRIIIVTGLNYDGNDIHLIDENSNDDDCLVDDVNCYELHDIVSELNLALKTSGDIYQKLHSKEFIEDCNKFYQHYLKQIQCAYDYYLDRISTLSSDDIINQFKFNNENVSKDYLEGTLLSFNAYDNLLDKDIDETYFKDITLYLMFIGGRFYLSQLIMVKDSNSLDGSDVLVKIENGKVMEA